jgi:hypothetical protein
MRHASRMAARSAAFAFVAGLALAPAARGQSTTTSQPIDAEYTAKIRELTPTDPKWRFTTELVDYLPASATVPTPLKVLGYVPGTVGKLSHVADVNRYFRAVAAAAPARSRLMSLGMSDENREELVLAVANEQTIQRLDEYRAMAARLADPRGISAAERARLIRDAKPIYWVLGAIHSPETGSPEMLMELAYRMVVDDGDFIRSIRDNVITLITPIQEVDGRDRMVDVYNQSKALKVPNRSLIYWGKYTAHDNNRDGMVVSQRITQNYMKGFLHWRPTITHDLHESVPFLYISTGTGPYNDEFDPITISEWHTLAYNEITELTRRGLAGVWTHGFYDGWAPNYMMSITQFHNSTGRFYETYTSSGADCQTVNLGAAQTDRRWYRPNPAVNGVRWCIRSNLNYQQSGVLLGLKYVGDHRATFIENNIAKAERMIARGKSGPPYAFVIPRNQRHAAEAADLVNLFRTHAAEVHEATSEFTVQRGPRVIEDRGPHTAATSGAAAASAGQPRDSAASDSSARAAALGRAGPDSGGAARDTTTPARGGARPQGRAAALTPVTVRAGDWIVRMDQPYTQMIRTMLAVQRYKPDDPSPYDDTGWTLDELRHVETYTIPDSTVLSKPMRLIAADATVAGRVDGSGPTILVRHLGDWRSAVLPWKAGGRVTVADSAFAVNGATYPAGTFIVADGAKARAAIRDLGLAGTAVAATPTVRSHAIALPRIAYIHTWQETQNEGWVRFSLDRMGIPYTYMADQKLRNPGALDRYDVVVFPHSGQGGMSIVNGRPMIGPAIPWRASRETPHLGKWDETDDTRPGMGLEGAAQVRRFVERGGLLVVEGSTGRFPIELGLTPGVTEFQSRTLGARGAVFRAEQVTVSSPILYGYDTSKIFPVYFNQTPLFQVQTGGFGQGGTPAEGTDPAFVAAQARARPRVILRFLNRADSLGISGMLNNPGDLAGRPAVIDAPLGNGHVVMFAIRPFWRYQTQGSWALALNAIANWNHLTDPCDGSERCAASGRVTDSNGADRD